jgi:hypothetical protein
LDFFSSLVFLHPSPASAPPHPQAEALWRLFGDCEDRVSDTTADVALKEKRTAEKEKRNQRLRWALFPPIDRKHSASAHNFLLLLESPAFT